MRYPLTEEQLLIQQSAREFAEKYVEPEAARIDRDGTYPAHIIKKLAEHDFLGLIVPAEYGGIEAGFVSYVLAIQEISRISASVGAILINHCSLAAYSISRWGSSEQKECYLPAMCRGENLGAFALYEPEAAPGCGAQRVVATRKGNGYVLKGRKYFVANGGVAGVYVVFALTEPDAGSQGMSAFIVDAGAPGLSVGRHIDKMGLRGCPTTELIFDDVEVPGSSLLGTEGGGLAVLKGAMAVTRISAAAQIVGIVQAALQESVKYAKERVQFGRPIAQFPAIQNMIAEMATNLHLAKLAVYSTADLMDKGEPFETEAAMVHMLAARIGQRACTDAVQIHGGYGYSRDLAVERLFRDVKGAIITDSTWEYPECTVAESILA
ncbi:acyl-CoA dehydrogenase family protein [Moorellaceae bacterium AZ2]